MGADDLSRELTIVVGVERGSGSDVGPSWPILVREPLGCRQRECKSDLNNLGLGGGQREDLGVRRDLSRK